MHLIIEDKKDFEDAENYLKCRNLEYKTESFTQGYFINIFNNFLEDNIIDELIHTFHAQKISLENGYLVTKKYKEKTVITVDTVAIGGGFPVFISGPCSIESEEQLYKTALAVKKSGCNILRGGAFKARTSPYEFQGLGKCGLDILCKVKKELNMPVITELLDMKDIDLFLEKVDIIQIGSRNMHNSSLLKELGKINKPILLKRGLSATLQELLLCAEYIMLQGNEKVILCERGIRTFETYTRNTMDIASIALLKELTHLPIIADPSHATGNRNLIKPMTYASIAAGADGIMIESHINPEKALCDGKQSIYPKDLREIINTSMEIKKIL